jgi:uncharacterized membrane protein YgaE (UPF0421/DUF939 family)
MTTKNEALARKIEWTKTEVVRERAILGDQVNDLARHASREAELIGQNPDATPHLSFVQSDVNQIETTKARIDRLEAILEALRWVDQFEAPEKGGAK